MHATLETVHKKVFEPCCKLVTTVLAAVGTATTAEPADDHFPEPITGKVAVRLPVFEHVLYPEPTSALEGVLLYIKTSLLLVQPLLETVHLNIELLVLIPVTTDEGLAKLAIVPLPNT